MGKSRSAFQTWAEAQFGPRPKAPSVEAVRDAEARAAMMRAQLTARQRWDAETSAALYAWQIKDADKKVRRW